MPNCSHVLSQTCSISISVGCHNLIPGELISAAIAAVESIAVMVAIAAITGIAAIAAIVAIAAIEAIAAIAGLEVVEC
jgi:hypothetical protein